MATLPTLVPISTVALGTWTVTGVANRWEAVDEGIAAANDTTDYVSGPAGVVGTDMALGLTDMPSDFGTMTTLSFRFRHAQTGRTDDTVGYSCRIVNGATILAAADSGGTFQTVIASLTGANATFATGSVTAFTYVNTTANKTTWDGAALEFRHIYTVSMGSDNARAMITALEITGTYTPGASGIERAFGGVGTTGLVIPESGAITVAGLVGV